MWGVGFQLRIISFVLNEPIDAIHRAFISVTEGTVIIGFDVIVIDL